VFGHYVHRGLDDLLDEHVPNGGNRSGGTGHADEDHHGKLTADLMRPG
jgi:hypothetical protein